MAKLLTVISLILAIVFFPPAVLAVISNNAVPGDATYPIKRILEDGIFAVASLNSVSKAWFAAARSDRRFKEFTTLIAQGKKSGETLNELVEQTQVAAGQIDQVKDESQKQKLIQQLSESIKKYDQGLQQLSTQSSENPIPAEQSVPAPLITAIPTESGSVAQPKQTAAPVVQPAPKPASTTQPVSVSPSTRPVPTAVPAFTPHPTPIPTPVLTPILVPPSVPVSQPSENQGQIDEARRQLEEIRRRLAEQQSQSNSEHSSQNEGVSQQNRQENRQSDKKEESKDKSKRGKD